MNLVFWMILENNSSFCLLAAFVYWIASGSVKPPVLGAAPGLFVLVIFSKSSWMLLGRTQKGKVKASQP